MSDVLRLCERGDVLLTAHIEVCQSIQQRPMSQVAATARALGGHIAGCAACELSVGLLRILWGTGGTESEET